MFSQIGFWSNIFLLNCNLNQELRGEYFILVFIFLVSIFSPLPNFFSFTLGSIFCHILESFHFIPLGHCHLPPSHKLVCLLWIMLATWSSLRWYPNMCLTYQLNNNLLIVFMLRKKHLYLNLDTPPDIHSASKPQKNEILANSSSLLKMRVTNVSMEKHV